MSLSDLLNARHSCRAFRPDPVPESVVQDILRTAGRTPSWCNAQPWKVTVTRGAATEAFRTVLLDAAQGGTPPNPDLPWPEGYPGLHGARRKTCGFQLYEAVGIDRGDRAGRAAQMMRNFALFDAPHVAIIHSDTALGPYGALDCGAFVTAFMLAATERGVASIAQASLASYPDLIRAHFGLEPSRMILCAVSFGYADTTHPANSFRTERAPLEEFYDPRAD